MKDLSQSSITDLVLTAVALPVITLAVILVGVFVSNGAALAQDAADESQIPNESYFTEESELAQAGDLLEPRSAQMSDDQEDEDTDESDNGTTQAENSTNESAGQCSQAYLQDNLRIDFDNDRTSVLKLQSFLKTFEGYNYVSLTGTFDADTLRAVKAFQTRYAEDVLQPWGYESDEATGYVYITTKKKINEIYCDEQFLLSQSQQVEIRNYREKLNMWRAQGASFETPNYLAKYYGIAQQATDSDTTQTTDDSVNGVTVTETPSDEIDEDEATTSTSSATSTESDDRGFFERLFGIGGDDDKATTSTSTDEDATSTDADDEVDEDDESDDEATTSTTTETDDRGFFQRLFGIGDDDKATTSTSTDEDATSTDTLADDDDGEETATSATDTAATSGISNLAAGVYNGVNSIVGFLLSPTFLLIVLVILILLLIATIIEGGDGDIEDEGDVDGGYGDDGMGGDEDESDDDTTEEADDDDIDPWKEYDETQELDTDDEAAEDADSDTSEDREVDGKGSDNDTDSDKKNTKN